MHCRHAKRTHFAVLCATLARAQGAHMAGLSTPMMERDWVVMSRFGETAAMSFAHNIHMLTTHAIFLSHVSSYTHSPNGFLFSFLHSLQVLLVPGAFARIGRSYDNH